MSLISKTIPGLYNGISQQPAVLRLDNQGEIQENLLSSLVDGLIQRPPTQFIKLLLSKANEESFIGFINRDETERYIIIFNNDPEEPLEIYTLEGEKCTIIYEGEAKDYISVVSPKDTLRIVSIADHTFVLNKDIVAEMDTSITAPGSSIEALVYIKKGVAHTDYKISVNGASPIVCTTTEDATSYKTDQIAKDLVTKLNNSLDSSVWGITYIDQTDYIVIFRKDGQDFTLDASDTWGNAAIVGIKGTVQKFTDLPIKAPEGMVVEVAGDDSDDFDSYYLKYSEGVWRETVKPGLYTTLKASTLPHKIARTAFNTFTVSAIEWEKKAVGDEFSAPDPSFIGRKLNDIFFYRNRLGILAGDSVIMSKAGDYFDFFPTTALDVLDDDPIDVAVAESQVSNLMNALTSYNTSLIVDAGTQQFILDTANQLLTPKTAVFDSITTYTTNTKCKPVSVGTNAYFIVPNGKYSHVYEYFIQPDTLINGAANITAHVPKYLLANIIQIASNPANDLIFFLSSDNRRELYIYKYFWNGNEKVQSSWSKWIFDDEILGIICVENYAYLIQRNQGQIFLVKMDLAKINNGELPFIIHLDKSIELQGVYDEETGLTTWTLPYEDSNGNFIVVDLKTGNKVKVIEKTLSNLIQAYGDYSDREYLIGKPYSVKYRFSEFVVKSANTNVADLSIKLQIRTLALSFTNTSYFRLVVTPASRNPIVHEFTGTTLGVTRLGSPSLITGNKTFLIMANSKGTAIDIESDSYLPFEIQTATYQAFATKLSRGI